MAGGDMRHSRFDKRPYKISLGRKRTKIPNATDGRITIRLDDNAYKQVASKSKTMGLTPAGYMKALLMKDLV